MLLISVIKAIEVTVNSTNVSQEPTGNDYNNNSHTQTARKRNNSYIWKEQYRTEKKILYELWKHSYETVKELSSTLLQPQLSTQINHTNSAITTDSDKRRPLRRWKI